MIVRNLITVYGVRILGVYNNNGGLSLAHKIYPYRVRAVPIIITGSDKIDAHNYYYYYYTRTIIIWSRPGLCE